MKPLYALVFFGALIICGCGQKAAEAPKNFKFTIDGKEVTQKDIPEKYRKMLLNANKEFKAELDVASKEIEAQFDAVTKALENK